MQIGDLLPEVRHSDPLTQRVAALFALLQLKVGPGGSFRISGKSIALAVGFKGEDGMEIWIRVRQLENIGLVRRVENGRGYVAHRYQWIGDGARRRWANFQEVPHAQDD